MKLYGGYFGKGVCAARGACTLDGMDADEAIREQIAALEILRFDMEMEEPEDDEAWGAWYRKLSELDDQLGELNHLLDE